MTCAYGVYKGMECIARSSEIFTPLILFVIAFYAILQIPEMDFNVFLPVLADSSFTEINFLAFITAARMHEIIFLAMLVPSIKSGNIKGILFWIVLIIVIFSLIIILPTLAGLGLELAKKTFDPYYLFIKQISVYDFITRIEFLIVFAWNISMFLKISLMLYLASMGLVQIFNLKNSKILIIPMVILVFASTLLSGILKSVVVFNMIEKYIPYINLIFILVIPVIAITAFFLKKNLKAKNNCNS
jgi:spore germination protein (amino acid permease)